MHKIDQVRNDSWYAAEAKNAAIALHMAGDYEQARVHYKILLDLKLKQLLAIEAISVASVDRLAHTAGFDAESKKLTNLKKAIGTSLSTQDNSGLRIRRTWKNKGGTLEDQDIQHGDVEFEFVQSALPNGYIVK